MHVNTVKEILGDYWITLVFICKISINAFRGRAWFLLVHGMVSYADFSVSTLLRSLRKVFYVSVIVLILNKEHLNLELRHWPSIFILIIEIGYRALRAVSNEVSYSQRSLPKRRKKTDSGNRPARPGEQPVTVAIAPSPLPRNQPRWQ